MMPDFMGSDRRKQFNLVLSFGIFAQHTGGEGHPIFAISVGIDFTGILNPKYDVWKPNIVFLGSREQCGSDLVQYGALPFGRATTAQLVIHDPVANWEYKEGYKRWCKGHKADQRKKNYVVIDRTHIVKIG